MSTEIKRAVKESFYMLSGVYRALKKSKILKSTYHKVVDVIKDDINITSNIPEITELNSRPIVSDNSIRLNLVIPSVNKEHVFGGISTALNFFYEMLESTGARARIIVTDAPINPDHMIDLKDYIIVPMSEDNTINKKQVVDVSNRYGQTIPIEKNDIFITTAWWCAYCFGIIIKNQATFFNIPEHKMIYFIQDYEPFFYAWSSRCLLADSTYRSDIPKIAIFNSGLLKEYFDINGYKFEDSYYFEPKLNKKLYECLLNRDQSIKRKKQIIVYGRPSVQRNAFELVVASLKKFVEIFEEASEWSFISMGEMHPPVDLGGGNKLISTGKLDLDAYANTMLESYMALSLMVSPHPSYPPLEMSTFGVKTITNSYCNKDLSGFNSNIISITNCNAESIANVMCKTAKKFNQFGQPDINPDYVDGTNVFGNIIKDITEKYFRA